MTVQQQISEELTPKRVYQTALNDVVAMLKESAGNFDRMHQGREASAYEEIIGFVGDMTVPEQFR